MSVCGVESPRYPRAQLGGLLPGGPQPGRARLRGDKHEEAAALLKHGLLKPRILKDLERSIDEHGDDGVAGMLGDRDDSHEEFLPWRGEVWDLNVDADSTVFTPLAAQRRAWEGAKSIRIRRVPWSGGV